MNECEFEERLMAYHDGELPPHHRAELERHLDSCAACREELRRLRALSDLLGRVPAPRATPAVLERMHRAAGGAGSALIVRFCRPVAVAAAALLVVTGIALHTTGPEAGYVPPPAEWEVAAVTPEARPQPVDTHEAFALWIMDGLSGEEER